MKQSSPEQLIHQLTALIKDLIPAGLEETGQELKQNLRAGITDVLANMDMVTREEFDIQQKVLARTRAKLEALEKRAAALEEQLNADNPSNN